MAHMAVNSQLGLSETWHWAQQTDHDWRMADPECYIFVAQALASEASKAIQGQLEWLSVRLFAGLHFDLDNPVSVMGSKLHLVC